MQTLMTAAGVVLLIVAAVHSVLGELLIFRHLRTRGLVPTRTTAPLLERHVRILWATWHVTSVLGLGFAALLLRAAQRPEAPLLPFLLAAIAAACLAAALFVLVGTKGRHPGWLGLSVAGVLAWLALYQLPQ